LFNLNKNTKEFRFPEIIAELERKPNDDNYFEKNIWPDNKG
jgi:hypothetical protein